MHSSTGGGSAVGQGFLGSAGASERTSESYLSCGFVLTFAQGCMPFTARETHGLRVFAGR